MDMKCLQITEHFHAISKKLQLIFHGFKELSISGIILEFKTFEIENQLQSDIILTRDIISFLKQRSIEFLNQPIRHSF